MLIYTESVLQLNLETLRNGKTRFPKIYIQKIYKYIYNNFYGYFIIEICGHKNSLQRGKKMYKIPIPPLRY